MLEKKLAVLIILWRCLQRVGWSANGAARRDCRRQKAFDLKSLPAALHTSEYIRIHFGRGFGHKTRNISTLASFCVAGFARNRAGMEANRNYRRRRMRLDVSQRPPPRFWMSA